MKFAGLFGFSIMMGTLDGFNPCATGALIFLLGMLMGFTNRKRVCLLGSIFIFTSAIFYFLVMTVWLHTLTFLLNYLVWIRIVIGSIVIAAGLYNLWQFFRVKIQKTEPVRRYTRAVNRVQKALWHDRLWPALVGVVMLALSVNLLEFLSSSGLPILYVNVLALQKLAYWQNYFFLLIYIIMYMLDDILIFLGAMLAWQVTGSSSGYARYLRLFGGIMMIVFGIVLIIQPTWLSVN